jgi:hypothetical protein
MDARSTERKPDRPWVNRNGWRIGLALAALAGGGYLWRRNARQRRIAVDGLSERWLAQREFTAGQHPDE